MQTVETASHVVARLSSTPRWRKARARPRWKATECHLGEIWGDMGRYVEVWGGMGRFVEVWGGVGRYRGGELGWPS